LARLIFDAEAASHEHIQPDNSVHAVQEGQVSDAGRDALGAQRAEADVWQHRCQDAALLSERHDFTFLDVHAELLCDPPINHAGYGPRINEEIQPFERTNGAGNDDLVSLAQFELEGSGTLFAARAGSTQGRR
jgi:hypothetical protein